MMQQSKDENQDEIIELKTVQSVYEHALRCFRNASDDDRSVGISYQYTIDKVFLTCPPKHLQTEVDRKQCESIVHFLEGILKSDIVPRRIRMETFGCLSDYYRIAEKCENIAVSYGNEYFDDGIFSIQDSKHCRRISNIIIMADI